MWKINKFLDNPTERKGLDKAYVYKDNFTKKEVVIWVILLEHFC